MGGTIINGHRYEHVSVTIHKEDGTTIPLEGMTAIEYGDVAEAVAKRITQPAEYSGTFSVESNTLGDFLRALEAARGPRYWERRRRGWAERQNRKLRRMFGSAMRWSRFWRHARLVSVDALNDPNAVCVPLEIIERR